MSRHGGLRKGAGRKKTEFTERVTIKMSKDMKEDLLYLSNGESISDTLRKILKKEIGRLNNDI